MKQIVDVQTFIKRENKKVSIWFVSFALTSLLYVRAIISANLAILKDYKGQSLDSLPWYTYTYNILRHGSQSYTSSMWLLAVLLSFLVAFTLYKLMKALFIRSIYTEKFTQSIGYIAIAIKTVLNPLMIIGTIYAGYSSAKLLDMQFKHLPFAVIGAIDWLGNFGSIIIVVVLFFLVRWLSYKEVNFQNVKSKQEHRRERQEYDKMEEIRNIRRGL